MEYAKLSPEVVLGSEEGSWLAAAAVLQLRGEGAIAFIADQVAELARAGDLYAVRAWRLVAARVCQLTGPCLIH